MRDIIFCLGTSILRSNFRGTFRGGLDILNPLEISLKKTPLNTCPAKKKQYPDGCTCDSLIFIISWFETVKYHWSVILCSYSRYSSSYSDPVKTGSQPPRYSSRLSEVVYVPIFAGTSRRVWERNNEILRNFFFKTRKLILSHSIFSFASRLKKETLLANAT